MRREFLILCLFLFIMGCTSPLSVNYTIKPEHPFRYPEPIRISFTSFADKRDVENPRLIGRIDATVFDMTGSHLILDKEPSIPLKDAFEKEFSHAGFVVVHEPSDADIVIDGEIRRFRYDIGPRDEIEIELYLRFLKGKTGEVIWSGVVRERDDRYAGVMGNTRKSMEGYIISTISKVTARTLKEVIPRIEEVFSGKDTTEQKAQGYGRIVIKTVPPRARVYLDGVYYGLTPFTMDKEPGIYELTIRLDGFVDEKEKIGVRRDHTTEIEITLKKK